MGSGLSKPSAEVTASVQQKMTKFYGKPDGSAAGPLPLQTVFERLTVTPGWPQSPESEDSFVRLGDRIGRVACVSLQGYYPYDPYKPNQDKYNVVNDVTGDGSSNWYIVLDGHGNDGHFCAEAGKDQLPVIYKDLLRNAEHSGLSVPEKLVKAHVDVNEKLHASEIDDSYSGTTCVSVFFEGSTMYISNVGDSRAIIGRMEGGKLVPKALTHDQTLYRKDERDRVKSKGGRVMTIGQIEGEVPPSEDFACGLGDEIDEDGDPPRIWLPHDDSPGCAFSRSIGDSVAEMVGCNAVPEIASVELDDDDRYVIIATDGVWEFLTNKAVVEMVSQYSDPAEACHAVVAMSYKLWLEREERSDDITMIVIYVNGSAEEFGPAPVDFNEGALTAEELADGAAGKTKRTRRGSLNNTAPPTALDSGSAEVAEAEAAAAQAAAEFAAAEAR